LFALFVNNDVIVAKTKAVIIPSSRDYDRFFRMSKNYKEDSNLNHTERKNEDFQYYLSDCDCLYCLYYRGKPRGCSLRRCCCGDIKADAIANGRIKRPRGVE